MCAKLINNKKFWSIAIIFAILIASLPLCAGNLTCSWDIIFHINRIEAIKEGIEQGQIPVKIYGYVFNNYGYPSGVFYPDLFLYIPAIMRIIGFNAELSYNFFLFVITFFTAIISYYSFTKLFYYIKNKIFPNYVYSSIATILYTCGLYRLADLYIMGTIGEVTSMIFMPLALISFYLTLKGKKNYWIGIVIGITGILQSHILSSLMIFLFYVFMSIFFLKSFFDKTILKNIFKAVFFIIILNIWFYGQFISMYDSFDFYMKENLKGIENLRIYSWEELLYCHFFVGILPIVFLFYHAIYLIYQRLQNTNKIFDHKDKLFFILFAISLILILMTSPIAPLKAISNIPILGEKLGILQYTHRLFAYVTFFMSIALSIAICANKRIFLTITLIIIEIILIYAYPVYSPSDFGKIIYANDKSMVSDRMIYLKGTVADNILISSLNLSDNPHSFLYFDYLYNDIKPEEFMRYSDQSKKEYWEAIQEKNMIILNDYDYSPHETIKNFSRNGLKLNFTTNAVVDTEIKLPLWYFPHSYKAECDGEPIPTFEVNNHRLAIITPKGNHNIKVYPALFTPYKNACIISFFGLIAFIVVSFRILRKKDTIR